LSIPNPATGTLYLCNPTCVAVTPGMALPVPNVVTGWIDNLQFDPAPNYEGVAYFNYYVIDNSNLNSSTGTYSIPIRTIYPVADDVYMTQQTNNNTFNVLPLSASDGDGSIATYYLNSIPPTSQGTLSCAVGGCPSFTGAGPWVLTPAQAANLRFTPNPAFIGVSTFNFSAIDNLGNRSNEATFTIPLRPITIPIYFVNVKAKQEGNINTISWQVTGNENVVKYHVQRMLPNGDFADIGSVTNNVLNNSYSFNDVGFGGTGNVVYYRIILETNTGVKLQSEVVVVRLGDNSTTTVWPNPVRTNLYVSLRSDASEKLQFKLFTIAGQEVRRWNNVQVNQGSQVVNLDGFENLNSGVYIIKAFDNNNVERLSQRVMKRN
jgi:hypothetical protein